MDNKKLVEILYSYTRRANLTSDQHDECRAIAQQLLQKFDQCCPEGKCVWEWNCRKEDCKEKVEE